MKSMTLEEQCGWCIKKSQVLCFLFTELKIIRKENYYIKSASGARNLLILQSYIIQMLIVGTRSELDCFLI